MTASISLSIFEYHVSGLKREPCLRRQLACPSAGDMHQYTLGEISALIAKLTVTSPNFLQQNWPLRFDNVECCTSKPIAKHAPTCSIIESPNTNNRCFFFFFLVVRLSTAWEQVAHSFSVNFCTDFYLFCFVSYS